MIKQGDEGKIQTQLSNCSRILAKQQPLKLTQITELK